MRYRPGDRVGIEARERLTGERKLHNATVVQVDAKHRKVVVQWVDGRDHSGKPFVCQRTVPVVCVGWVLGWSNPPCE